MSRYDFETYAPIAKYFVRKALRVTFAANSLTIGLKSHGPPGVYIWIDPPWRLYRHRVLISWPDDYPRPGPPLMLRREQRWFARSRDFYTSSRRLFSVGLCSDDTARFVFDAGWELRVPAWDKARDESRWYDDWYARRLTIARAAVSGRSLRRARSHYRTRSAQTDRIRTAAQLHR